MGKVGGPVGAEPVVRGQPLLKAMRQGEIYWALTPDSKKRPVVVVSRDDLNRGGYVVCVQITSAHLERRRKLPHCVPFRAVEFGLDRNRVAQAEAVTFLERDDLDTSTGPIGILDSERLCALVRALGHVIDSDCEPR